MKRICFFTTNNRDTGSMYNFPYLPVAYRTVKWIYFLDSILLIVPYHRYCSYCYLHYWLTFFSPSTLGNLVASCTVYLSFFRNRKTFGEKCWQKSMHGTGTDIWNSYKWLFVGRKIVLLYWILLCSVILVPTSIKFRLFTSIFN